MLFSTYAVLASEKLEQVFIKFNDVDIRSERRRVGRFKGADEQ